MVRKRSLHAGLVRALTFAAVLVGGTTAVRAEPAPLPVPMVHHAAPPVASPDAPLLVRALVEQAHLLRRLILVYRALPSPVRPGVVVWKEAEFLLSPAGPYVATVPADAVHSPGLDYTIEIEFTDGHREPAFATRLVPQHVSVFDAPMDVRERLLLERLEGRRSSISAGFEYVGFGDVNGPAADRYYRTEASYTYRLLRTVDQFTVNVGVVRGRSPGNDQTVGLNYASAALRLRITDLFRLEGEFLTSVTETGFAGGGGGAVDIGDPFGSRMRLGFEAVHSFGSRFYSQVDVPVTRRLTLSPIVEATNMPHADRFGVRLVGEVTYDFGGGFAASVRGGYQARESIGGGPSAGAHLTFAF
jgi:hypothetical protein